MQKGIGILLALLLVCGIVGCKKAPAPAPQPKQESVKEEQNPLPTPKPEPEGPLVGIYLPGDQWQAAGAFLERELVQKGYRAQLLYADHDATLQAQQIENIIAEEPVCLVVMPEDSVALLEAEKAAKEAGVPIVAYDRLLMETNAVAGLVTFDYEAIGREIGNYLITKQKLDTATEEDRTYTIEFFMGSTEDHSAFLLHKGLMEQLQPYLDSGALKCKSGRTAFADTYVLHGQKEQAVRKCTDLLTNTYRKAPPDILCTASDALAEGCLEALGQMTYEGDPQVLITGQGGELEAVQRVVSGKQTMTVYKDWETLATQCAEVVDAIVKKETPRWSQQTFHNQAVTVPACMVPGVVVDKANYKKTIVEAKIYSLDALPKE